MSSKILLVDDDKDILEFLSYNLKKAGFEVDTAVDGSLALLKSVTFLPDLIVMDVMMPVMDGIETCEKIRQIPEMKDVLITFLTARSEDYSLIAGLNAGADDYISKPVKPKVLVSKIQSLLRRKEKSEIKTSLLKFKDVIIDKIKYKVIKNDNEVKFTKREFKLLLLLFSEPGKLFTRDEIMQRVWEENSFVGDRTIDVHIRKLRQKLGDDFITTIKGIGYQLQE